MRYGKKISAVLAATMVFSSLSGFAAAADNADAASESLAVETIAEAEIENTELEADEVNLTVKQSTGGTIEIANYSKAGNKTVDITSDVAAGAVIDENEYFTLTAPSEVVKNSDKSGVFGDNPNITTAYIEFRNTGTKEVLYNATATGSLTVYAGFEGHKAISCKNIESGEDQKKYTDPAGTTTSRLYSTVVFDVVDGGTYQIYANGGTGRFFGLKFESSDYPHSSEALAVSAGDTIKVMSKPADGYAENPKILVNGVPIDGDTFTADANAEISAVFELNEELSAGKAEFEKITIPETVTENLTLPTSLSDGLVTIEWESNNENVISSDGKVKRPTSGDDVSVTLTANAVLGGLVAVTKSFNVLVTVQNIELEFGAKEFVIPETVTENFSVDGSFGGIKLNWSSDAERYLTFSKNADANGKITATVKRPYFVEGDQEVTIKVALEGTSAEKTYKTKVIKNENSGDSSTAKLIAELIELEGDEKDNDKIILTSNIDLPLTNSTYGGVITWISSNPKVVSSKGVVTRPTGSDVNVRLTAVVEQDGVKATREFTVTVKGKKSSSSGGSGGGSGFVPSSGGGAGGVVASYTEYNDIVSNPNINTNTEIVRFNDLQEYAWAAPHISRLVNKGIVKGVGDNRFDPNGLVTREQFATMLVRAFEFESNTDNAKAFSDVEAGSYYEQSVAILSSMGIVKGQSDTTFGVGQSITRQDLAVMAALASNIDNDNDSGVFNDEADISDYALESVNKMRRCGVLAGDENNNFNPKAYATRAEAAKIISVIMDYKEKLVTK